MRIGVLGTGMVGQALASRLVETGHDVVMGSRDAANEKAAAWAGGPAGAWQRPARSPTPPRTARSCSTPPAVPSRSTCCGSAGADNLAGKVLIDVSNPMKPDSGFPPQLDPVGDDSLAEQIQREFPTARVVKTLNTMNCDVMVDPVDRARVSTTSSWPARTQRPRTVVRGLLRGFGWPDASIRDVGGIAGCPGAGDVPHLLDRPADQPRPQRLQHPRRDLTASGRSADSPRTGHAGGMVVSESTSTGGWVRSHCGTRRRGGV